MAATRKAGSGLPAETLDWYVGIIDEGQSDISVMKRRFSQTPYARPMLPDIEERAVDR